MLAALWELLRGFEQANRLAESRGQTLLGDLPVVIPSSSTAVC